MRSRALGGLISREQWDTLRRTPPFRLILGIRTRVRKLRIKHNVRRLWGADPVTLRPDQATVVCLMRDAEYYLDCFVKYYTALGVQQIVLLDNGSTDRTLELARRYDNVTLLQSKLPFNNYQYLFREYMLRRYGVGGWRILVDCDELLDWPRSEDVPLAELLGYLNGHGYNTMVGQLLDMFDDELPRGETRSVDDLRSRFPYYDLSNITTVEYEQNYPGSKVGSPAVKLYRGGIRRTIFGTGNWLTKHPLIRLDGTLVLKHNVAHDVYNARAADLTGVLYHYKFTERFIGQAERAVREENYALWSYEYKRYHSVLSANSRLRLRQPTSRRLVATDELLDQGFLVASPTYLDYAAHRGEQVPA